MCEKEPSPLPVHLCVAPTRLVAVMVHVMMWAGRKHGRNLPGSRAQVNRLARPMHRAEERLEASGSELNCARARL